MRDEGWSQTFLVEALSQTSCPKHLRTAIRENLNAVLVGLLLIRPLKILTLFLIPTHLICAFSVVSELFGVAGCGSLANPAGTKVVV